jgi:hypothetical protein
MEVYVKNIYLKYFKNIIMLCFSVTALIIVLVLLLFSYYNNKIFINNIIKSLETGNYDFIIENSDGDIKETAIQFNNYYNEYEYIKKLYYITIEHMYEKKYNLILWEEYGRLAEIYYEKENWKKIIKVIHISSPKGDISIEAILSPPILNKINRIKKKLLKNNVRVVLHITGR